MTYNNPAKRAQMAHVTNLISMARFNGQVTENETDYILMVAKTFNLSQEELDQCYEDSDNLVIVTPLSEEDKLEYLTNLFTMVFTESTIDEHKRDFAKRICERYGCDIGEVCENVVREGIVDEDLVREAFMEEEAFIEEEEEEPIEDGLRPVDDLCANLYRSDIEDGAGYLMENEMSEAFSYLLFPAWNGDETARRLFLRIPDGVFPMYMLSDYDVNQLKEFAESGCAIAQYALGRYYQLVRPSLENLKKAHELFDAAAAQGLGDAYCGLANLAHFGFYEEADIDKYHELMDKALDNGSQKAFYLTVKDIIYGWNGRERDPQKMINMLTDILKDATGDDEKDVIDCEPDNFDLLGRAYEETGQKDKAKEAYLRAVNLGYYEALSHLIYMTCYDEYGNLIDKEAFDKYINLGIEHNDAACFSLRGNVSAEEFNALGLLKKAKKSMAIQADLEKACQLGDSVAPWLLGNNYYYGNFGFEQNDRQAWKWYNMGALYCNPDCYSMMAQMIDEGHCPKKVSEKFRAFCILNAYRLGDESKLEEVIKAYNDGLLDDFKNEIEKYYV